MKKDRFVLLLLSALFVGLGLILGTILLIPADGIMIDGTQIVLISTQPIDTGTEVSTENPITVITAIPTNLPELPRPTTLDCITTTTNDGFYPINDNYCLTGRQFVDINPQRSDGLGDDRVQCVPSQYQAIWARGDNANPSPFTFCQNDGGMKVDIGYQFGQFGLGFHEGGMRSNECYLLKASLEINVVQQPFVNGSNLQDIGITGRIVSSANNVARVLERQSPDQQRGTYEYIWAFTGLQSAYFEVYYDIRWASFLGEVIFENIEIFAVGPDYCNGSGTINF